MQQINMSSEMAELIKDPNFLNSIKTSTSFDEIFQTFQSHIPAASKEEVMQVLMYLDEETELLNDADLESIAGGIEVSTVRIVIK